MTQQILERATQGPLDAALGSARQASTFGQLIGALSTLADALGDTDTADALQGQMQYGLRKRGQQARKAINAKTREILARVDGDPDALSDADRDVLRQYSGRGGIADDNSLSEYYTPQPIAEGVWDALKANGFENGNVLEPSTGAGVFLATKPAGTKVSGAEIDPTSSSVAALLHPDDDVSNQSFEQLCATAKDNTYDSVVGNVPFGDARGKWAKFDPEYQDIKEMERYFITRAIDKVRFGGLLCLIVPPNIVSKRSKTFTRWRRDISRKAEFLGAHKLPSGTFGGANGNGTDTVVDVLVMRKHSRELTNRIPDLTTDALTGANVYWDQFIEGRWFERDGKRFVHGEIVEGFRTQVKSEIDNAGLKRLLARKFDSRIDFAALDSAETVTRNYQDGDRRVIGMQMHELAGGEWVKVDAADGVYRDGALDAERYGAASQEELTGILGGEPAGALALSHRQAANAVNGRFADAASGAIRNAVRLADQADEGMRERVYRAALVGNEVNRYARAVSETGQADDAARERLQRLVTAEVEQYGNPSRSTALRQVSGPGASDVGAFMRSVRRDGGFSDLLTGKRDGSRGEAVDTTDPADVLRFLAASQGNGAVTLDDVKAMYSGDRALTIESLAESDAIAVTADGHLQPMEHFASGNVVSKIARLREALAGELSPALADKFRGQIDEMNRRRTFTDVDDIDFSLRGKWFDRELVAEFLNARGYDFVRYDATRGQFTNGRFGTKPERFNKQLLNFLNGQTVRSKDAQATAEYKQQIRDLADEFGTWMRQRDDIDELVARYNDAFNDHVPVEYDGSDLGLENVADWITPHDYQAAGVRRLSDEGRGVLAFDVGLGKAQPMDAKILTPDGWRRMGDIAAGDMVMAADGTPTRVTGVFPQGEKEIFEVVFSDGAVTRCCDEHLWLTQTEKDRKKERYSRRKGLERSEPGTVKPLSEIRDTLVYQTQKNHRIPMAAPAQMPERDVLIDPYVMGVLIGDGALSHTAITFTPGDDEIAERVSRIIANAGTPVEVRQRAKQAGKATTYGISRLSNTIPNVYHDELQRLALMGSMSHEKFIPDEYKLGSIEQRTELLRGLMDTDGYVSKDGVTVQFSSTSAALAGDVRELAQSLGGIAWTSSREPTYTHNGEKRQGRTSYTVSMRLPAALNPFWLARKAERVRPRTKYQPVRYITEVNPVGRELAQCISVEHSEHLYVTDDYIVTHNTLSALSLAQYNAQKGRAKRTCITVPKAVLENWYHESRQFHKSMGHVLFVGFTPKMKGGEVEREPVLDAEGNPKVGRNGEVQYRDVLLEDSAETIFEKMNDIPQTSKTLVVMSRERFGMIPMRPESREAYADKMVSKNLLRDSEAASLAQGEDVKLGRGGSYDEAKQTERYQQKFNDDGTRKQDAYPFFEDMGFDSVIVDEGHEYKNTYQAGGDTQRLAYLPTPQPSKRALDMAMKMDHLRGRNQGAGPVMLTATPVTNSPVEVYNMLSHIVPSEQFEQMGISNVDDFVDTFCEVTEVQRTKLSGEVVTEEGVAGFKNLDGLRSIFHRYTNMKSAQDVNDEANSLKIPDHTEVHASVDMTAEQARIYEQLREEADNANQEVVKQAEDGSVTLEDARPVFAIIRDMDRITTDMDLYLHTMTFTLPAGQREAVDRLVADLPARINRRLRDEETGEMETVPVELDETLSLTEDGDTLTLVVHELYESEVVKRLKKVGIDEKDVAHPVMPKYAKLLENLRSDHENGGKQIVFTEEKSQHDKLKRIIVHHLPIEAKEIGIINADTAGGDKLEKISSDYNTGKVRIVLANRKAEVGVNLQKGTTAIHHLTLPWTPASIQQRNGRGVRQGNTVSNVNVIYYMGKGSFDGYRLDMLKRKANWINDLFFGDAARADNANAGSDEDVSVMLAANPEEQRRRIAEAREQKEQQARERANKRATIDLTNYQKHKAFLAGYDAAEQRAVDNARERGRSEDDARARMQKKRDKAQGELRQIEGRLTTAQEKGRIDIDAKRLMQGGEYLTTLDGQVIEAGQCYETPRGMLMKVSAIDTASGSVTLKSIDMPNVPASREAANKLGGYKRVEMSEEAIDQRILSRGGWRYHELANYRVDAAFLRENAGRLVRQCVDRRLLMVDDDGELHAMELGDAEKAAEAGMGIAKPRPSDAEWHRRASAALFAGHRQAPSFGRSAIDRFGRALLGDDWLKAATDAFGNPPSDADVAATFGEIASQEWQAYQDNKLDVLADIMERVQGDAGASIIDSEIQRAVSRATANYSRYRTKHRLSSAARQSLVEAGYDVTDATLEDAARSHAEQLDQRVEGDAQTVADNIKAMRDKRAEQAAADREAAAAEGAQMAADAVPETLRERLDELGIEVKVNTQPMSWKPKGGGKRPAKGMSIESEAGSRLMLFDPQGYGGPLSQALSGRNNPLQKRYNAVWTIFEPGTVRMNLIPGKGDLWWHMPLDGLDFDALMEAFE